MPGSHLICWAADTKWLVSTPAFTGTGVCISTRSDTPLGLEPSTRICARSRRLTLRIVHVADICEAIRCTLEAPVDAVNGEIFNVGQSAENYRIRELAQIIAEVFPGCELTIGPAGADNRSYRVSFDKIHSRLPGFFCHWDARRGAEELRSLFERIEMSGDTYEFRAFTRLKQLKYLQRTGQLDDDLYWRPR